MFNLDSPNIFCEKECEEEVKYVEEIRYKTRPELKICFNCWNYDDNNRWEKPRCVRTSKTHPQDLIYTTPIGTCKYYLNRNF